MVPIGSLMTTPMGPLMIEHRLIEVVSADIQLRLEGRSRVKTISAAYVEQVADFIRGYADRCHHGKEEDILFRELSTKKLAAPHAALMKRLVAQHRWVRGTTSKLGAANASLISGNQGSMEEVRRLLRSLVAFYPKHIRLEDKEFFSPAMGYLTAEEQQAVLVEFTGFDASLIHERYRQLARDLQTGR